MTVQRHTASWLTDPPPASDARSSKRYRPSFPAFDKALLSVANSRLSINTFSEFLQFTTCHILLTRYIDLTGTYRKVERGPQEIAIPTTCLKWAAHFSWVHQQTCIHAHAREAGFQWRCQVKTEKNPSSYLNALMLRLTSPATEFDEDAQLPLTPYSNTGNPSAIKTWSNIRATACRNVATAVLHSQTRKPTSHISKASLNSFCSESLVLRWQLWSWW